MPTKVDPAEKRVEFIDASWNVIAEQGFGAVTMRRVAAAAGCTTGALTHYFPDRHALLVAALRAAHIAAAKRMARAARNAKSDFDRLRAVLLESLPLDDERLREWKVWLAFWGASMSDFELAGENDQRYDDWQSAVQELLEPLSDTADADAEILVALVDGLGLKIARHTAGEKTLAQQQSDCRASLDRILKQFQM